MHKCTVIDPLLARTSAGALVPWLGRSSASALGRKSLAIDRSGRNSNFFPSLLFKFDISINAFFSSNDLQNTKKHKKKIK